MKKFILLLCLLILSYFSFSQGNFVYLNNNKYPTSETLKFNVNKDRYVNVRFAINRNKGLIEIKSYDNISGNIRLYLKNGNFIRCIDRGFAEVIDGEKTNIYKLTESEMDCLCVNDISKIRYSKRGSYRFNTASCKHYIDNNCNTAKVISKLRKKYNSKNSKHNYNALISNVANPKSSNKITSISIKPNYVEAGRKYGKKREATMSGKINTMTVIFKRNFVIIHDDVEDIQFNIVGFEWRDNDNGLWIDFSNNPREFYMIIVFENDGLVFINDENDPQPGEEYKSMYFKELEKEKFKKIYN